MCSYMNIYTNILIQISDIHEGSSIINFISNFKNILLLLYLLYYIIIYNLIYIYIYIHLESGSFQISADIPRLTPLAIKSVGWE